MRTFILPTIRSIGSHPTIATTQTGNQFTQTGDDCDRDDGTNGLDIARLVPSRDFREATNYDTDDNNYRLTLLVNGNAEVTNDTPSGDGNPAQLTYVATGTSISVTGSIESVGTIIESQNRYITRRLKDDCVELEGIDGGIFVKASLGQRLEPDAIVQPPSFQSLYVHQATISSLTYEHLTTGYRINIAEDCVAEKDDCPA